MPSHSELKNQASVTLGSQISTPRGRKVRILATLGPASANPAMIAALHRAGADAFRVNMSHGDHAGHAKAIAAIRALEKDTGRPTTILVDLQGPKLRVGRSEEHTSALQFLMRNSYVVLSL